METDARAWPLIVIYIAVPPRLESEKPPVSVVRRIASLPPTPPTTNPQPAPTSAPDQTARTIRNRTPVDDFGADLYRTRSRADPDLGDRGRSPRAFATSISRKWSVEGST